MFILLGSDAILLRSCRDQLILLGSVDLAGIRRDLAEILPGSVAVVGVRRGVTPCRDEPRTRRDLAGISAVAAMSRGLADISRDRVPGRSPSSSNHLHACRNPRTKTKDRNRSFVCLFFGVLLS